MRVTFPCAPGDGGVLAAAVLQHERAYWRTAARRISRPQAQVQLALPGRQFLTCRGFQQLDLGIAVRGSQVLDIP